MAFKGEGAGMLMIQNEEVATSITVKIAATLHMALSILKFGKDLPHLSKQGKLHEVIETAQHEPCGTSEEPEEVLEGRGQGDLKPSKVLETSDNKMIMNVSEATSAIRQLAYGVVSDSLYEYLQIGDKIARDCLVALCNRVMELYVGEYFEKPIQTDVEKLYAFHEEKHWFHGMLGSIDCTKCVWAQCPTGLRGQFCKGDSGSDPFILLEAVASQDLWI
ncbi:ALP1-like protein [Tanacetum coccineum]